MKTICIFASFVFSHFTLGQSLHSYDIDTLNELAKQAKEDSDPNRLNFYGKIQTQCEFDDCFSAVVASGRTNFEGDGGDLANIYVPANDYDSWKQYTSARAGVEGEFVYQMQNETLSCLTVELRWGFAAGGSDAKDEPVYQCMATPLAMNWDCHLDWALVTECSFNATTNQVSALYTVTNMGPEQVYGEGKVVIVNKHGDEEDRVRVVKTSGR